MTVLQFAQMLLVTLIRHLDEVFVKTFLVRPALVCSYQQNGFALRIESKGNSPNSIFPIETQFLHIREG
ncbi:hypothetical protein SAMN06295888_10330 [Desulfonatronum zhilinae]|nr:hypothetical protein SAMN06295888_10330 [Desulfonatronum zhilinae]